VKTAVILAAGQGTKMWPFSETQPKVCLPIAGQPLIVYTLNILRELGFEDVRVVVGHLEEQVRSALSEFPDVRYYKQTKLTGSAGALQQVYAGDNLDECLVIYGDVLVGLSDIRNLLDEHKKRRAFATTLVMPLKDERLIDWLCVETRDDMVSGILGHPRRNATHRFTGIVALSGEARKFVESNPGVMTSVLAGQMPLLESELAQSLQDALDAGQQIYAIPVQDMFVDIDKPWHLLLANREYLKYLFSRTEGNHIPSCSFVSPKADVRGKLILGENVYIGPGVRINGDLMVGDNTIIDNGAIIGKFCSIGRNCRAENYCQLSDFTSVGDYCQINHCAELSGLIMDRVHLYHFMEYDGVIGRATDLGAGTVCGNLRFDDANTVHCIKGRREYPKDFSNSVYIGDFCRTGVNVSLMPGVKVGPYSVIGVGVLVDEDIPSRTCVYLKQELAKRAWGPEQYGW
jgi:bifunctional UDP-N-acetylglucosamine pyrophosphorylase/glucosamine-1-phosphate N-acetyltransferase